MTQAEVGMNLTCNHAHQVDVLRLVLATFSQLQELLEREKIDVVGRIDCLWYAVYLMRDWYAAAQFRVVLYIVHSSVSIG